MKKACQKEEGKKKHKFKIKLDDEKKVQPKLLSDKIFNSPFNTLFFSTTQQKILFSEQLQEFQKRGKDLDKLSRIQKLLQKCQMRNFMAIIYYNQKSEWDMQKFIEEEKMCCLYKPYKPKSIRIMTQKQQGKFFLVILNMIILQLACLQQKYLQLLQKKCGVQEKKLNKKALKKSLQNNDTN